MTQLSVPETRGPFHAAIIGTGYISDFHARAVRNLDGVELVAVCDKNLRVAQEFGRVWGVPSYDSPEAMLDEQQIDAVHLLTPPDLHHSLARAALEAGVHVFVEKPMCVSVEEADDLVAVSTAGSRLLRVSHNLTFYRAFKRLREHISAGELGPIDYACFNHFAELGVIRSGPFDSWMLREPGNVFLEIGSHLVSELIDLIGTPGEITTIVGRESILPGGSNVYRRWHVHAEVKGAAIDLNIDLSPGFSQRLVYVRGLLGSATADLEANVCTIDRRRPRDIDFDRYSRSLSQAAQIRSQARKTLADYILSKTKIRKRGNPFESSILESVDAFYSELRTGDCDKRISASLARDVINVCSRAVAAAQIIPGMKAKRAPTSAAKKPDVLVLGGAGFIGRRLIPKLLEEGHSVRAVSRSASAMLEDMDSDRIEVVRGDIRSTGDLGRILDGIDHVFHLATSGSKTWDQYCEREIQPARALAEACLVHGVRRLIYTGTIDSYYAGGKLETITEDTPLDARIRRRNYYARAKAAVENLLLTMHSRDGLPLVIVRPGIVIGKGGNPFHWGVGKWLSEGVCQIWGDGRNKLPFVLVDDVATGLAKTLQAPGIEGRSYNLIDAPMLSARDYLEEFQRLAGMRIDAYYRAVSRFYLDDLLKWTVKKAVGHPDGSQVPSYRDWESRTQRAYFDCSRARDELAWTPCGDRERMIADGIAGSLAAWLAVRT